jgi:long-subunit acyl-CoA synthetase (AMP-forming)
MAGINVVTTYGMSEMSGGCIYNGRPLDGVDVRVIDSVIELDGPMKAIGYLGEEPFSGFFRSSDLGELHDGSLHVIGRADDQIISGGAEDLTRHNHRFSQHREFTKICCSRGSRYRMGPSTRDSKQWTD